MAAPQQDDALDRVLAERYRLQSVVGRGGMATVYKAVDESLNRTVAIKVFHSAMVDPARQEAELGVLSSLEHHGLVGLFDAGVEQGPNGPQRFLVMPLIAGLNLEDRLRHGALAARHIAEIGYDMAEALDYIHGHSVVHRDIKPSNILLVDYGDHEAARARAKLADFGIALTEDVERLTAEGVTTGTAAYLSPEQAVGGEVGPPSDVYSLGLVLLQCFTRRREFPGSLVESAVARLSRDPVLPDPLPEHWRHALRAMTRRDPAERPTRAELVALMRDVVITETTDHRDGVADLSVGDGSTRGGDTEPFDHSEVLDTLPNEALDRVTAMAARLFSAPIALATVIDDDRTWFTTHYDPAVGDVARQIDLSQGAVHSSEPLVIEDAATDRRVATSPLVTGPLGMRFYVSVPLTRRDGHTIGTLSVIDREPGTASDEQVANLADLAALVVAQLELRQESLRIAGTTTGNVPHASRADLDTQAWSPSDG